MPQDLNYGTDRLGDASIVNYVRGGGVLSAIGGFRQSISISTVDFPFSRDPGAIPCRRMVQFCERRFDDSLKIWMERR
jgi:hypothetical protein